MTGDALQPRGLEARRTALGRGGHEGDYRCAMEADRVAMARALRRRQARESLEFEKNREVALVSELERVLGERDVVRIDALAFAKMSHADVELVREQLATPDVEVEDSGFDFFGFERDDLTDEGRLPGTIDPRGAEIARIEEELGECRRLQQAFETYLAALEDA